MVWNDFYEDWSLILVTKRNDLPLIICLMKTDLGRIKLEILLKGEEL